MKLLQLVDRDINVLDDELMNIDEKSLKENEINQDEIDVQLLMFESFTRYCQEVVDKGNTFKHSSSC